MLINHPAGVKNRLLVLSGTLAWPLSLGVTLVSIVREKGPALPRHCVILLASTGGGSEDQEPFQNENRDAAERLIGTVASCKACWVSIDGRLVWQTLRNLRATRKAKFMPSRVGRSECGLGCP